MEDNESVANDSQARGGGIFAAGTSLKLKRSTITSNTVRSSTNSTSANSVRQGGGIYADNTTKVKITNSTNRRQHRQLHRQGVDRRRRVPHRRGKRQYRRYHPVSQQRNERDGGRGDRRDRIARRPILGNTPSGTVCADSRGQGEVQGLQRDQPGTERLHGRRRRFEGRDRRPQYRLDSDPRRRSHADASIPAASPAFNLVPVKRCKVDRKSDQRGAERPAGKRCDAGAYERTKCRGVLVDASFTFLSAGNDNDSGLNGDDLSHPQRGTTGSQLGGNDILCGGSGKVRLTADKGNDKLDGGPGTDTLDGGPGNDRGRLREQAVDLRAVAGRSATSRPGDKLRRMLAMIALLMFVIPGVAVPRRRHDHDGPNGKYYRARAVPVGRSG